MTEKRAALYVTWSSETHRQMDAIAAFIMALKPQHPLFPPPLRPARVADLEAGAYNEGDVAESCARLLAEHLRQGIAGDLLPLLTTVEAMDKKNTRIIKVGPLESHVRDLTLIAQHLSELKALVNATAKGGATNLKTPQDVAIIYAYNHIQQGG